MSSETIYNVGSKSADAEYQLDILEQSVCGNTSFKEKLSGIGITELQPQRTEVLQINLGKMCNQTCGHCHVDAGPTRSEIMTRETMHHCLKALENFPDAAVDLTGGAPELNPNFRWFVSELRNLQRKIMVRSNLTIILANKKYHDLPEFFAEHNIEVISSLPYFNRSRTDKQRGDGVFEKSIKALKMLNEVGYGVGESGRILNLVYNPAGAYLPSDQKSLETQFKNELFQNFGIVFNKLFCITNLPISRFLDFLLSTGNLESYMDKLIRAFNPSTINNLMCRNTISVSWDAYLYDCDFNQMLDLKIGPHEAMHISDVNMQALAERSIITGQHCFGCTAGVGSSCGGALDA